MQATNFLRKVDNLKKKTTSYLRVLGILSYFKHQID